MESFEPKKLALIRILQILKEYSDFNHPMTQGDIANKLEDDYGITIERKAIGRNISLLKEAGYEIESSGNGSYLDSREFEDAELHLLIDSVLGSRHITTKYSKELIDKLCSLSNKYFKSNVSHIYSINEWSKTENQALFFNIELIDEAINKNKQVHYDYNKYGIDNKLHKSSEQIISPYVMILHNQRYYLMGYSEHWKNIVYHRLDHITNMSILDNKITNIRSIPGYENGISFKDLSTTLPYMYADKQVKVEFIADNSIIDQIIEWFGTDIKLNEIKGQNKVKACIKVSPTAMEYWAMQYINYVVVISPKSLRDKIKDNLKEATKKYK